MIYTEGDNQITINNAVPMTEDVGKTLSDENHLFDFTININIVGNTTISYEVTAEKDPSSTLANNEVRLYLQKSLDGTNYNEEVLDPSPYEPLDEDDEFGAKVGEMVLDVGSTNKTVMYYYRLRMWVDESYELSEVAKTFTIRVNAYGKDGGYTIRKPKNKNIKGIYVYNEENNSENYCVTGEEETCEKSTCYTSDTVDSCSIGTIIKYAVNDQEEKYFHVLHDDGKTMTLQQRENTTSNTPWYIEANDNTKGPLTVLPVLENTTANWSNVNDQTYTMGETTFKDNPYTGCNNNSCIINQYTLPERTAKARMITYQELLATGCVAGNSTRGPRWVSSNLTDEIYGYWTMSSQTYNSAWIYQVRKNGYITGYNPNGWIEGAAGNFFGARAVVVINK